MFQTQHSQNVKTKLRLHKAPAGTHCHYNGEEWGPTLPFICLFRQTPSLCIHYYLGDLALNQGQRRSTFWLLITTVMLTYFSKRKGRWWEMTAQLQWLPAKLCLHPFSWLLGKGCHEYHYQPNGQGNTEARRARQIEIDSRWAHEMNPATAQQINNGHSAKCWRCLKTLFALCD